MSGSGKKIYYLDNEEIKNLTCSGSITVDGVAQTGADLKVNGNINISGSLASQDDEKLFCQGGSITFAVGTAATSIANLTKLIIANPTTVTLPALTTERIQTDSGGTTTAGGDIAVTEELEVNSGGTFNANGNTVTSKLVDTNGTATLNLQISSTLILSDTSGLTSESGVTLLAGGGGVTISGSSAATTFESQNDWKVVGKCENLNVTNEELNVTGQVINCTGDIIQQHASVDAAQQLDYDTADDRDILFGVPDLDKNTELVT